MPFLKQASALLAMDYRQALNINARWILSVYSRPAPSPQPVPRSSSNTHIQSMALNRIKSIWIKEQGLLIHHRKKNILHEISLHTCRLIPSQFHLLINPTYMTPFKVNFLEHKSIIKIGSLYNYLFKIEIILPNNEDHRNCLAKLCDSLMSLCHGRSVS